MAESKENAKALLLKTRASLIGHLAKPADQMFVLVQGRSTALFVVWCQTTVSSPTCFLGREGSLGGTCASGVGLPESRRFRFARNTSFQEELEALAGLAEDRQCLDAVQMLPDSLDSTRKLGVWL